MNKNADIADDYFRFKQFMVRQDRCAFKIGTDSVLLGSWADARDATSVLDIGTGTGLLALMMAQKCTARITGIEIDEPSYRQARENAAGSPWAERIHILHTSLQDFDVSEPGPFDLLICNPPYFTASMKSGDAQKDRARHDESLTLHDLAAGVARLMGSAGKCCLVLPAEKRSACVETLAAKGIYLQREMAVRPNISLPAGRYLMEFGQHRLGHVQSEELAIERSARHDYTDQYRALTCDFYLAF